MASEQRVPQEAVEVFRARIFDFDGTKLSGTAIRQGLLVALPEIRQAVLGEVVGPHAFQAALTVLANETELFEDEASETASNVLRAVRATLTKSPGVAADPIPSQAASQKPRDASGAGGDSSATPETDPPCNRDALSVPDQLEADSSAAQNTLVGTEGGNTAEPSPFGPEVSGHSLRSSETQGGDASEGGPADSTRGGDFTRVAEAASEDPDCEECGGEMGCEVCRPDSDAASETSWLRAIKDWCAEEAEASTGERRSAFERVELRLATLTGGPPNQADFDWARAVTAQLDSSLAEESGKKCERCGGSGKLSGPKDYREGERQIHYGDLGWVCPDCGGTGENRPSEVGSSAGSADRSSPTLASDGLAPSAASSPEPVWPDRISLAFFANDPWGDRLEALPIGDGYAVWDENVPSRTYYAEPPKR